MARLMSCGFEENNFTATMWDSLTGTPTISTTQVHSGTYAMRSNPTATNQRATRNASANATSGTWYVRAYVYVASLPSVDNAVILAFQNASGVLVNSVTLNTDGTLTLTNAITTTTATTTATLSTATWYRLELRYLISDTVGELELRLYTGDSTTATETETITGEDTLNTNARGLRVGVSVGAGSTDIYFDDIAWNDATGTFQTSWPGPGKIAMLDPDTDDTVAWTDATGTGTGNAGEVDELPGAAPDDDTSYVTTATSGTEDRYNLTAMPAEVTSDATIALADVYARIRGSSAAGTRTCRVLIWDEDATQTNGPSTTMNDGTAYRIMTTAEHLVLDTSGKTKADLDDFDAGAEPTTNSDTMLTALWVNVEWLEAAAAAGGHGRLLMGERNYLVRGHAA